MGTFLKAVLVFAFIIVSLTAFCIITSIMAQGQEVPTDPGWTRMGEPLTEPVVDKKFVFASLAGATVTMLDSYTTGEIYGRWKATPDTQVRPCLGEGESPWLYGAHPNYPRAFAVGTGQIIVANGVGYWLKKRHSRWWVVPFAVQVSSLRDVVHNFQNCQ